MRWQRAYADPGCNANAGPYRLASRLLTAAWFTATVSARWVSSPEDGAAVFRYLVEDANKVTRQYSVLDASAAQDEVNHRLAVPQEIPGTGATLMAAHVTLTVTADDLEYAERRASIDRAAMLADAELEAQRDRLVKLRDVFLADTATARLWWFDGDPGKLLALADKENQFETVVQGIAESSASAADKDVVPGLVAQFLAELSPAEKTLLLGQLTNVFASYERQDLVAALQMRVLVPDANGASKAV